MGDSIRVAKRPAALALVMGPSKKKNSVTEPKHCQLRFQAQKATVLTVKTPTRGGGAQYFVYIAPVVGVRLLVPALVPIM